MATHPRMNALQRENDEDHLPKSVWASIFLGIPLIFGLISLYLGKDINWDLLNYHYYNAYAFLNDRLSYDIAPAQLQTYINPFLDLPFFLLTQRFHSSVAGFVLGFLHGFNISLVFLIFWQTSLIRHRWQRFIVGVVVCCVSALGPGFVSEIGSTMNDNLVSLFVLLAIVLILASTSVKGAGSSRRQWIWVAAAGVVLGLGVGFKPTISTFAIASAISMLILYPSWSIRIKNFVVYGVFGVMGGLLSSGYWWWELYVRFGNPTMPFYNHIFKSPYITPKPFVDTFFLPKAAWEYFVWPLLFAWNSYRVNQIKFFDVRFVILYFAVLAWLLIIIARKFIRRKTAESAAPPLFHPAKSNFIIVFFILSFILWMMQSSVYRYIISLELLAPLCFLIILSQLVRSRKVQLIITVCVLIVNLVVYKPFFWYRVSWTTSYFDVDTSRFNNMDNVLVVMLGDQPTSFVIPMFPEEYRFIRPESNFISTNNPYQFSTMMKSMIAEHQGPIYILYHVRYKVDHLREKLANLKLKSERDDCFDLKVHMLDKLIMCQVYK